MRLLYGTTNPAKLAHMRKRLSSLPIELISLFDLATLPPDPAENGATQAENARLKAVWYRDQTGLTTLSADSGFYIEGLPESRQPGIHVRRPGAKRLDDEEMIAYYGGIAASMGGFATVQYRNALCVALAGGGLAERSDDSVASLPFWLAAKPHPLREAGFPLDALSVNPATGRYYYDEDENRMAADAFDPSDGYIRFVKEALSL